jgi:DNA-binding HxlR family transcriptional regulator
LVIKRPSRIEAKEFSKLAAVLGILVDTELKVLAKGLVELGKVVLVLRNLNDEIKGLLHNILADDLEDLVLLERFTRNVERKILRVDDTLHEVEVLGDEILAVIHNEDTADVELDVIALLLGFKEIERSTKITNE